MAGREHLEKLNLYRTLAVFRTILIITLPWVTPPAVHGEALEESIPVSYQAPLFDWHEHIRITPLFSARINGGIGFYGQDANAYRYGGAVEWHSILRAELDFTRLPRGAQSSRPVQSLGNARGEFRLPLRNWSLALGVGWSWERGFENHSGPSSSFGVEYRVMDFIRLDAESDRAMIDLRMHSDSRVGFSVVFAHAEARIGYRWLILGPRTLSGPELGLTARF